MPITATSIAWIAFQHYPKYSHVLFLEVKIILPLPTLNIWKNFIAWDWEMFVPCVELFHTNGVIGTLSIRLLPGPSVPYICMKFSIASFIATDVKPVLYSRLHSDLVCYYKCLEFGPGIYYN